MKLINILTFGTLAVLAAQTVHAKGGDIFEFLKEETVYSASKRVQKVSDAPASAYIVTANEIENYGYRSIAEALQGVPGFYYTNDQNYSYIWVRGFGRPSDYNTRVLLMVNGHRLNDNVYGSALFGNEEVIDIRSVERLEIVRGPGSALYGDNSFFATVNIVTKKPAEGAAGTINIEGASFGSDKQFADISLERKDGSTLYAAASRKYKRGQSFTYGEFGDNNGGRAEGMDRDKAFTGFLALSKAGWTVQGGASSRNKQIPTAAFRTLFNNKVDYSEDSRRFLEAEKKLSLGDNVDLSARLFYDWYTFDGTFLYDYGTAPLSDLVRNRDFANSISHGWETRAAFTFWGEENQLMLGHEYENQTRRHQSNYDINPPELADYMVNYINKNEPLYRWALYAQQEAEPLDGLSLTLGLRYDWYQSFGYALNPRAGVVYKLTDLDTAKLLYGSAFRAPNTYEMDYTGPSNIGNKNLKPENVRTYEAVYERSLSGKGFVSLSYFQNRTNKLISQITEPGGKLQFINQEKLRTQGIEASSKFSLADNYSGHLGYTLQDTREARHEHLTNSPVNVLTAGLSRRFPGWRTSLTAETLYLSDRRTTKDTTLDGTGQFSLHVRTQPWTRGPELYAGVYNLANTPYYASGSGEHTQSALRQDGRNYILGVDYRF